MRSSETGNHTLIGNLSIDGMLVLASSLLALFAIGGLPCFAIAVPEFEGGEFSILSLFFDAGHRVAGIYEMGGDVGFADEVAGACGEEVSGGGLVFEGG